MANFLEDIQSAGFDTRPPMLDRLDFASWQQRIRLFCMGKVNGENIIKSINEGPFKMGKFRETLAEGEEGALHLGPEWDRVFADLSPEEKERFKADINEEPVQDLALNEDVFQADQCDAFASDFDEAPTAQTMFMANLSSADPIYDEASPSYDSNILFEVQDHDIYQDAIFENHEVHEMHNDVQPNYVV
nr:integrase, catalytic region, zinc finger, CCHC-type, peptidase aspartic, catalytic [Tanacetum cinerariifolium]